MQQSTKTEDVFHCPPCGGALARIMGGLRCQRCGTAYPILGTLPCLTSDPTLWRTIWLRRLDDYSTGIESRIGTLRQQVEGATGLLPRTRARLDRLAGGLAHQLETVAGLFEPLDAETDPLLSSVMPGGADQGGDAAVLDRYELLFRDWVWGAPEVEQARDFVAPLLPPDLDRIAVFGQGAGRLAIELHQSRSPARTLSFDLSPLPLLVAGRLLAGETISLPEFPIEPRSDEDVVLMRELARPFPVREGFSLAIADALRPPVRAGSLDAVVTAWFIDDAAAELPQTAAIINRLIRPGGWWVNVGPLRFQGDLARTHTIGEVRDIAAASGFELAAPSPDDQRDLPVLDSPASGAHRTELVFRFAARKTAEAGSVDLTQPLPPWVVNPSHPIAITPGMVALGRSSMFTTGVLGMIDGSRSVVDLARELGRAWGVDPTRLQDELRAFLARIPG